MRTTTNIKNLVLMGLFAAILAVISQLSIPMPSGVPVTLQVFGVALTGCVLGWKLGGGAALVFLLLGAVGLPVFANFFGGLGMLVGNTGGFLISYPFMAALCGVGGRQKNRIIGFGYHFAGLCLCHFMGAVQYAFVSGMPFVSSFLLVSAPYFLKDVILVAAAYTTGLSLYKRLQSAHLVKHYTA